MLILKKNDAMAAMPAAKNCHVSQAGRNKHAAFSLENRFRNTPVQVIPVRDRQTRLGYSETAAVCEQAKMLKLFKEARLAR